MKFLLRISTEGVGIRSPVLGWSYDDFVQGSHSLVEAAHRRGEHANNVPVGLIATHGRSCPGIEYSYPTVLHAILDGWTLMAPPKEYDEPLVSDTKDGTIISTHKCAEWWLTK